MAFLFFISCSREKWCSHCSGLSQPFHRYCFYLPLVLCYGCPTMDRLWSSRVFCGFELCIVFSSSYSNLCQSSFVLCPIVSVPASWYRFNLLMAIYTRICPVLGRSCHTRKLITINAKKPGIVFKKTSQIHPNNHRATIGSRIIDQIQPRQPCIENFRPSEYVR